MEAERYALHIDESIQAPFIGVGGFICRQADIPAIEKRWEAVKAEMGLTSTDELKWSLGQRHPSRIAVQGTKWERQAERAPAMTRAISDMNVTLLCDVLVDLRGRDERGQADFYRHALKWLLGRFSWFLAEQASPDGPHLVIADQPPVPGDLSKKSPLRDDPAYQWLNRRSRIAFDVYTDSYEFGFANYWNPPPTLKNLGLYPSLLTSHADTNSLLQIADVVVGATTQCVAENLSRYSVANQAGPFQPLIRLIQMNSQPGDICMPVLWPKFRGYAERRVIPYGLTVFPADVQGWAELRSKMNSWY